MAVHMRRPSQGGAQTSHKEHSMFCNQCEQTFKGEGCVKQGVCGKMPSTAALQDLLIYALRGLSLTALAAREKGIIDAEADRLVVAGLFSTVTNVNFDDDSLEALLRRVAARKTELAEKAGFKAASGPAAFEPAANREGLLEQAEIAATPLFSDDPNILSLMRTLLFGLKGISAYTDHAAVLGHEDAEHYARVHSALAAGYDGRKRSLEDWVGEALNGGRLAVRAMELLDAANTGVYGHPEPTEVSLDPVAGKAILITGHDLKDLRDLLEQSAGKGIYIYTHGEMLPAHAYPGLKKYPHFAGHFGTAWQNQVRELPDFPGPVLFTTNCIQRPAASYHDNVFTTGLVGWPGCAHVQNGDFGPLIERALARPGFSKEDAARSKKGSVMVGFGHNAVLGAADAVIAAVRAGGIRHFYLVAGCDGAKPGRNYYTEFVERTPKDCVLLTLACGKFRFFDQKLGDIGGLPRLMDMGQCNDAFSAVTVAKALCKAFDCGFNDLPLSLILSWYEQKAVAVLLALLSLGFKNIRLGPSMPAFLSPDVTKVLADTFNIMPVTTADEDLKATLA